MHRKQKPSLKEEIEKAYARLIEVIRPLSQHLRSLPVIEGTGGKVSVANIIAYQIGWGICVIDWYEAGINGKTSPMPMKEFATWDYVAIARYFYQKHQYDGGSEQERVFHGVVCKLLKIVEKEEESGRLEKLGVWPWCALRSGKKWPLSKWIRVNTSAPYKRACTLISKGNFKPGG